MATKKSWLKRNKDGIIVGLILTLLGAAIGAGVTNYFGEQSQAISNSAYLALAHQNIALHNGLGSTIVQLPNGSFSNSDNAGVQVAMHITSHIMVFITCNDGTTFNGTGPFTCPGASP